MKNKKNKYSRRSFGKIIAFSSLGVLFSHRLIAFTKNQTNSKYKSELIFIDPMTAMTIAQTGMSLINSFTSGTDSTLVSMMNYQRGMLKVINKQLNSIQISLVDIQNSIDSLPSKIRSELQIQYKTELFGQIGAACRRYNDNILSASISNIEIFQNEQVKAEILEIMTTSDQYLSILRNTKGGNGPDTCLIVPLAMSLEMACRTNLNSPKEVIKSAILKYQDWFNNILSEKDGSINFILNKAISKHEEILSQFDNNPFAKKIGLSNYKLKGSQKSELINNPCVLFCGFSAEHIKGVNFDKKGGTSDYKVFADLADISSNVYSRLITLSSKLNTDLGVNLIEFQVKQERFATTREQRKMLAPKKGEYVYIYPFSKMPKNMSFNQAKEFVLNGNSPWKSERHSEREIITAIKEVNLIRAEIGLCNLAITVANNSKNRINQYLELI